jgi:hypothetical protein
MLRRIGKSIQRSRFAAALGTVGGLARLRPSGTLVLKWEHLA